MPRKLDAEGTSYQRLLADVRRSLAIDYLRDTSLTTEDIAEALGSGVEMQHVPFRETSQLFTSVGSGDVSWSFGSIPSSQGPYKAGKLRYLAIAVAKRVPQLPDVPTVAEAGGPAGFEVIASRRKAEKLREVMRARGIEESRLARLQAPAGPDAGAKTPGEIALVTIVGVLALLRGRHPGAADAAPEAPQHRTSSSTRCAAWP